MEWREIESEIDGESERGVRGRKGVREREGERESENLRDDGEREPTEEREGPIWFLSFGEEFSWAGKNSEARARGGIQLVFEF
jgi:hypothetical protein